jgi:L-fuconolactonase
VTQSPANAAHESLPATGRRFVDAHMHLWDARTHPWYHFPVPGNDFGLGLKQPFPDVYTLSDYRKSMAIIDVRKCVHVTAVARAEDVLTESAWIGDIAQRGELIRAIIGTIDQKKTPQEIDAMLDRECASPLYRGIRMLEGLDYQSPSAHRLLDELASRNLVYDAVAHSDGGIAAAARGLRQHEDLIVVLEHTGWPSAIGKDAFAAWRHEMQDFARLPNTSCKLSGLGMVVHATRPEVFSDYFCACIDLFGPERCMFASNFPVDLGYGNSADLFAVFEQVAGRFTQEAQLLFEGTAERIYRI